MDHPRAERWPTWRLVVLTGVTYAGAAEASWRWFGAGSAGLAFFPAAGVSFAALVLSRRAVWPWLVVAIAAAETCVDLAHGSSLRRSLGWAAANAIEPLAGALAVQFATIRHRGDDPATTSPRIDLRERAGLGWFVLGGMVAGPAVGALVGATIRTASTGSWWENAGHWIAGDGLGVLAVGAPVVVLLDGRRAHINRAELALVAAAAVAVGAMSFTSSTVLPTIAVLPLLVWAAARLGVDGVAPTGLVLCVMANHATASDHGPFARLDWLSPQMQLAQTQLYLTVSVLTGWFLAVEVGRRVAAVAQAEAEAAERRLAVAGRDVGLLAADLTGATSTAAICRAVGRRVTARFGPSAILVSLVDPATGRLVPVTDVEVPADAVDAVSRWDVHVDAPGPIAMRTGELLHLACPDEISSRFPVVARFVEQLGIRSVTAVPLAGTAGTVGYLSVLMPSEHQLAVEDRQFVEDVGRTVADAVQRVRLFEAEHRAREVAEQAQREMRRDARGRELLARISEVVAVSADGADPRALLRSLAEAAVPSFVDVCSFRLLEGGELVSASLAADPPSLRDDLGAAVAAPLDPDGTSPIAVAFQTGDAVVARLSGDGDIDRAFDDAPHRLALRNHRLETLLCVPLPRGRETSGVVAFALRADRAGELDVALAEEFVRRCAALVDEVVLRERATASRRDAERAAARAELVSALTDALSRAQDGEQVRRAVVDVLPQALGARHVDLVLHESGGIESGTAESLPHREVIELEGADRLPVGWLILDWDDVHLRDDATAVLLDTLADISAQALERAAARRQEVRQRRRSEAFATLAAELSAAATVDQVLHVAGNSSLALFDAEACAVLRRSDPFGTLRLLFALGLDRARLAEWSSLDAGSPAVPARAARYSCLIDEKSPDGRGGSVSAVPISASGSTLGVLVVELRPGHVLDQADRRMLLSVAAVVSQATERALGFEVQADRRAFAERAQRANAALAAASGTDEVVAAVFGSALELLDADEVVLVLHDEHQPRVQWRTVAGDEHGDEAAPGAPLPTQLAHWLALPDSPVALAAGIDRAIVLRALEPGDPSVRGPSVAPATALASIPLRLGTARGGTARDLGTVHVVFGLHRRLDEALDETCRSLQAQWTDALRRARAFDLELAAVARLQVLQRITAAFGAARTSDDVIRVVETAAGEIGARSSSVDTSEAVHGDTAPATPDEPAVVVLSLVTRQGSIGRLRIEYDPDGEAPNGSLVETVADLCAQALDRTRSSDFEHDVAVELQRSMLGAPDLVPRVEIGSSYRPSVHALDVGGDWYDVIRHGREEALLVVGDVVGHSLRAAAAMGQLRSAVRALAPIVARPADLLSHLDGFVEGIPAAMYTTMCAIALRDDGDFQYASAGHPPAVLVHPDGTTDVLGEGRSAPLGIVSGTRPTASGRLRPDDLLVLYTDGLIERRDEPLDEGIERLRASLSRLRHLPPAELAGSLVDSMLDGRTQGDDIAVLVARLVRGAYLPDEC